MNEQITELTLAIRIHNVNQKKILIQQTRTTRNENEHHVLQFVVVSRVGSHCRREGFCV